MEFSSDNRRHTGGTRSDWAVALGDSECVADHTMTNGSKKSLSFETVLWGTSKTT